MKKRKINIIIWMFTIVLLFGTKSVRALSKDISFLDQQSDVTFNVRAIRNSDTSIRLRWHQDSKADGYIIYRYLEIEKKYKKIKMINNSKKCLWVDRHLKNNHVYYYKIISYTSDNDKKNVQKISGVVSAKTYKKNEIFINAGAPIIDSKELDLGLCSEKRIHAKIRASRYGSNKKKKPFSKKIQWYSDNPMIVNVDKNGKVIACDQTGKCNIYAVAHNGRRTMVPVIVNNYAKVSEYYNYDKREDICILIEDFKSYIQSIAEYYSVHRLNNDENICIELNDQGEIVTVPSNIVLDASIQKDIEKLMIDFPYYISLYVYSDSIEFVMKKNDGYTELPAYVEFYFDNDCSSWTDIQIAPHWTAYTKHKGI